MKWTPCDKTDCEFFQEAECELKHSRSIPRNALNMNFATHDNVVCCSYGSGLAYVYPCVYCTHYEPTKFNLYEKKEKENATHERDKPTTKTQKGKGNIGL